MASRLGPFFNRFQNGGNPSFMKLTSLKLLTFATWIPALIFFNSNVGHTVTISGESMYPFLNTDIDRTTRGDTCWVNKWKPLEGLRRGMIVTFWSPLHPEVTAVKRVIALEGDTVFTRAPYPYPYQVVPAGCVWVEGDGAHSGKNSLDSNTYGPISMNLITGRVTQVVWPWRSAGKVNWWEWRPKTKVIRGKARNELHWS